MTLGRFSFSHLPSPRILRVFFLTCYGHLTRIDQFYAEETPWGTGSAKNGQSGFLSGRWLSETAISASLCPPAGDPERRLQLSKCSRRGLETLTFPLMRGARGAEAS